MGKSVSAFCVVLTNLFLFVVASRDDQQSIALPKQSPTPGNLVMMVCGMLPVVGVEHLTSCV